MTGAILVVEDDDALASGLCRYLGRKGLRTLRASSCAEAFAVMEQERDLGVVLTDVTLGDGLGFEVADHALGLRQAPKVIVMSGDGSMDNAIRSIHHGAADFLIKPFSFQALDAAIERALSRKPVIAPEADVAPSTSDVAAWRRKYAPEMLGNAPALMHVFGIIERVADTDCSVLITGESGTGKELVARAIHTSSDRRGKPFVTINCAAIPETLLESELFGHARGAFTGATQAKIGRFTAADGGTIFLDEIGELPLSLQAKLLRVLQEKEVTPVGDMRTHKVDVRIVAATNRDLETMVDTGKFREDLLYRLNVIPVELPSLRERRSDIPDLIEHFVKRANDRRGRSISGLEARALDTLCAYDWPGNIRQLENTIERMVVLRSEGEIGYDDLPAKIRESARRKSLLPMSDPVLPADGIDLRDAVEKFENALIRQALERSGWNKNRAATILQMNRTTLVEKLKKKEADGTLRDERAA